MNKKEYTYIDDNIVLFGSYPQTLVDNSTIIAWLNDMAGDVPDNLKEGAWRSYRYFSGDGSEGSARNYNDYMWYIDIECEGEKYRGVYFKEYRPSFTILESIPKKSMQHKNGFLKNAVYWFHYEPIEWTVCEQGGEGARLLANAALDAQPFQSCFNKLGIDREVMNDYFVTDEDGYWILDSVGEKIFANDYPNSTIRKWLNTDFFETAFNEGEKQIVITALLKNDSHNIRFVNQADTEDKVFLPSYSDLDRLYGEDMSVGQTVTDYAKCQGAYASEQTGNGWWWVRSPHYEDMNKSYTIDEIFSYDIFSEVHACSGGAVPSIWLKL